MALEVEVVVDGGVSVQEALCRPGGLEALHFALSAPHGLMRVFGAIVLPEPLLMRAGQAELPERRAIGAKLVGSQQFRCETQFAEQLAHQPQRRPLVAPALNEHVEDLALVIDSAPQVHVPVV